MCLCCLCALSFYTHPNGMHLMHLAQCDNKILYDTLCSLNRFRTHTYHTEQKNRSNWFRHNFLFQKKFFFVFSFCRTQNFTIRMQLNWLCTLDVRRFRLKWACRYPYFSSVNNNLHSNKFGNGLLSMENGMVNISTGTPTKKQAKMKWTERKAKRHWAWSNLVIEVYEMGSVIML